MNETDITMPMKFGDTNLFIIYPNPTVAAKVARAMASSS